MVDIALIGSGGRASLGNRRGNLPLAIGLHAGILGTLIGVRTWSTGEPPEPELRRLSDSYRALRPALVGVTDHPLPSEKREWGREAAPFPP